MRINPLDAPRPPSPLDPPALNVLCASWLPLPRWRITSSIAPLPAALRAGVELQPWLAGHWA